MTQIETKASNNYYILLDKNLCYVEMCNLSYPSSWLS